MRPTILTSDNAKLSAEEAATLAEFERRFSVVRKTYVQQSPTIKQKEFLDCTAFEALFGGAAGGGKSSALLMCALQYVHLPGYSSLILRRTYQDLALAGAIMSRSHEWLQGTDAKWDSVNKKWIFPSGSILQFGYLESDQDRFRYQSAEFQFCPSDDLTQSSQRQSRSL